ncbi:MAG: multifunctional CCA addition/repair protein [Zoogloeaceae bacterium]|nr:multifunctional CCA addition/repair protein [Zoogloeaceae bacterium]
MQIYAVGGAVRDEMMGQPVSDRDYVVVGATPEILLARGFKPVGKDFPVFLHPETHEEYALARTEKKDGRGYHGFCFYAAPEVTLEEDLARRDLTINAMARGEDGALVDPFHGRADLEARVLRHVGAAFVDDPVRLLRVARFAARFSDFSLAPETAELMRRMVENGEIDHLTPERVWREVSRGLMERAPQRMLALLRECGALARLMPEIDALFHVPERVDFHPEGNAGAHVLLTLAAAARMRLSLAARFAALTHDLGKALTPAQLLPRYHGHEERGEAPLKRLCERLKVPVDCRDLARLAIRQHGKINCVGGRQTLTPGVMTRIMEACDLKRRPERFTELLQVCEADARGRLGQEDAPWPPREFWQRASAAFCGVDGGAVAASLVDKTRIQERLHAARVAAVRAALAAMPAPP